MFDACKNRTCFVVIARVRIPVSLKTFDWNTSLSEISTITFVIASSITNAVVVIKLETCFEYNPPWILVKSSLHSAINFTELPMDPDIDGRKFKLLCSTIASNSTKAHLEAIFTLENRVFLVNDMKESHQRAVEYLSPNSITSFSFYMC